MSDAISIGMRQNSVAGIRFAGSQNAGGIGGGSGGDMDDVLRRIGNVETQIGGLAVQVGSLTTKVDVITTKVDGLSTKLDVLTEQVAGVTAQVSGITAQIPHLARKEDVLHVEIAMLRWLIGTIIAAMSLVFVIARFVQ